MNGIKFANPADEQRFTVGFSTHSHDGIHWIDGTCRAPKKAGGIDVIVTKVDRRTGTVEVEAMGKKKKPKY